MKVNLQHGTWADQFTGEAYRVEITNKHGERIDIVETEDGQFRIVAGPGRSFSFSPEAPGMVKIEIKS